MKKLLYILLSLLISFLGIFLLIWKYPLRYPPPQFESSPVRLDFNLEADRLVVKAEGAFFQHLDGEVVIFRAFVPEPVLNLKLKLGEYKVKISNVHPAAVLQGSGDGVRETRDQLSRHISIKSVGEGDITLRWRFPESSSYKFAAIGDTGENDELAWVIERANQLGVHFLLHLGDIYYDGNYQRAAKILKNAPFPVYVALGNHDYLMKDGNPYQYFQRDLGPRNSWFSLGGIQFLNIDTAADTIPWFGGERGNLLRDAPKVDSTGQAFKEVVAFTHRPIGLEEYSDHVVSRPAEANWLKKQLLSRGVKSLLAGHLHETVTHEVDGLKIYVAGEGLGTRNLVGGWPMAQILIGSVNKGRMALDWQPLNMPFNVQCSLRNRWIWEEEKNIYPANREAMLSARKECLSQEKKKKPNE
ncbi:metallophosphoesterase family protein [Pseudomonadota bacterium]